MNIYLNFFFTYLLIIFVGKTVGSKLLVVAMHRSQNGNESDFNELTSIDTSDNDLCSVNLIIIHYSGIIMSEKNNKKAQQTIKDFLFF